MQRISGLAALLWALTSAGMACAAGGAHLVDDAGVETPGTCHLETWVTGYGAGRGLANLSPGCTREAWPRLELGGALQVFDDHPNDATIGPAAKLNLVNNGGAFGLAVTAAAAYGLKQDRWASFAVDAPLSWTLDERTQLNLNAGWSYTRAAPRADDAIFGLQYNRLVSEHVSLMAEMVGHIHLRPAYQAGLRWNPAGGPYDLDLLVGHRIDGVNATAVTVGLTVRR